MYLDKHSTLDKSKKLQSLKPCLQIIGASLSELHLVSTTRKFGVCHGPLTFNRHSIYYIYIIRHAVSHFRLLFCEFLRHSLFQKLVRRHEPSMATARTETTCGPTYSMARAIWATTWQKGFICRCHYLHCHSQWKSFVTWTNLHREGYRMSYKTARVQPRFCFIYCGLRYYAQSHSDNGHVHATAPCFAHALAQARSHNVLHSTSSTMLDCNLYLTSPSPSFGLPLTLM